MRKTLNLLVALSLVFFVKAQEGMPVEFKYSSQKISDLEYEVRIEAKLEEGWHIYSQNTPDGGPVATNITFNKNPIIDLVGAVKEQGKLEKKLEPLFGVEVLQFSDKVVFVQKVKLKNKVKTAVSGSLLFMVCNEEMCMPGTRRSFSIPLQ